MPKFTSRNKKKLQPKPRVILMDKNYPIGHGTGLTEKQWQEFADAYESNVFLRK